MMGIVKADDIYGKTLRPTKNRDNIDKIKNQKAAIRLLLKGLEKTGNGYFTFCLSDLKVLPKVISLTNVTVEGLFC